MSLVAPGGGWSPYGRYTAYRLPYQLRSRRLGGVKLEGQDLLSRDILFYQRLEDPFLALVSLSLQHQPQRENLFFGIKPHLAQKADSGLTG